MADGGGQKQTIQDRTVTRRRVLVSAFAASPKWGSEPAVGWNVCTRLARYHDVTVLCTPSVPGSPQENYRQEIAEYFAEHGPIPGLHFEFVEPPLLSRLFQRQTNLCRRTVYYVGYAAWQRAALARARQLHAQEPFELVHQLNIIGYREPGYLWKLGIPFVWGPVGGAANLPPAYTPLLRLQDKVFYTARRWTNELQKRTSRRCRKAAAAASHIWVVERAAQQMVEDLWGYPAEFMSETGTTARPQAAVRSYDGGRPLRVVWSGEHVGLKAFPIIVDALASLPKDTPVELTVLGSGPETQYWKELSRARGVAKMISWIGMVPHARAVEIMSQQDVLAFTGVQEATTNVVPESLSLGLPVVCHACCGMGVAVTDECGIRVPLGNPQTSADGFARAIREMAVDPQKVQRLSRGALARAEELSWEEKARRIAQRYSEILEPIGFGGVAPYEVGSAAEAGGNDVGHFSSTTRA